MSYISKNELDTLIERIQDNTTIIIGGDNHREHLNNFKLELKSYNIKKNKDENYDSVINRLIQAFR